ncbi:Protein LTV1 [Yarrowia sp. B02]|nr:Protein LTV1 [Yarrowia sp. B02]
MGKTWVKKKDAETFSLVYRAQDDPLYHDEDSSERVFVKVDNLNQQRKEREAVARSVATSEAASEASEAGDIVPELHDDSKDPHRALTRADLEAELEQFAKEGRRENEGEAALYGIEFDDSKYDYMQHLRPMGMSDSVYLERKTTNKEHSGPGGRRGKGTDLILKADYAAKNGVQLPAEALPSDTKKKLTYQDQQDIPDAHRQLLMDPDLREVLEALEDEAYVEEDAEEDVFGELIQSGEYDEEEEAALDDQYDDEDYDDYSDAGTIQGAFDTVEEEHNDEEIEALRQQAIKQARAMGRSKGNKEEEAGKEVEVSQPLAAELDAEDEEEDEFDPAYSWQQDFDKFKKDQKKKRGEEVESEIDGAAYTAMSRRSRRKREKAAKNGTAMSGYSMTSSALFRNEGLTFLDDRFDKVEAEYNDESKDEPQPEFDMKKERNDFESIMDDFMDNYSVVGKKMYKKKASTLNNSTGLQQVDDLRRSLRGLSVDDKQKK